MRRHERKGITLIELMIVIAVLTLLAAFLFPVFAQAREKACQARCIGNLQQMATAMLLYSEDHDDMLPPTLSRDRDAPVQFSMTWMSHLQPYLKGAGVYLDPTSGRAGWVGQTEGDPRASYAYAPSFRARGYLGLMVTAGPFGTAMWDGLGGYSGPPVGDYRQTAHASRRSQVARPSEAILICDHSIFDWGVGASKLYFPAPRHLREPDLQLPGGAWVAQGRINAAFVDGHVQALRHEQLWAILPDHSHLGRPTRSVYRHFWPYE